MEFAFSDSFYISPTCPLSSNQPHIYKASALDLVFLRFLSFLISFSLSLSLTHTHMHTHINTHTLPQHWLASSHLKHAFCQFKGELTGIIGKNRSFWDQGSWNLFLLDIRWTQSNASIMQCHRPPLFADLSLLHA